MMSTSSSYYFMAVIYKTRLTTSLEVRIKNFLKTDFLYQIVHYLFDGYDSSTVYCYYKKNSCTLVIVDLKV